MSFNFGHHHLHLGQQVELHLGNRWSWTLVNRWSGPRSAGGAAPWSTGGAAPRWSNRRSGPWSTGGAAPWSTGGAGHLGRTGGSPHHTGSRPDSRPEGRSDTPICCKEDHQLRGARSHNRFRVCSARPSECNDRSPSRMMMVYTPGGRRMVAVITRLFGGHLDCPPVGSDTLVKKPAMFSP